MLHTQQVPNNRANNNVNTVFNPKLQIYIIIFNTLKGLTKM